MPRLTQPFPKYRHNKATNRAVVTLNGRDVWLGPYGSKESREKYDRIVGEWAARGRVALVPPGTSSKGPPPAVTIIELMVPFLRHCKAYYVKDGKVTTEFSTHRAALRFIKRLYGRLPAKEFSPLKLKAAREAMIQAGLSRPTINAYCHRIIAMFSWAVSNEMLPGQVVVDLREVGGLARGRTKAYEPEPVAPVSDDVVEKTLPFLTKPVAAMVQIQRLTGMRPGEVCRLRGCDIDRTADVWVFRPGGHKTEHHGHKREIAIGPKAQEILSPFLFRAPATYCFPPREALNAAISRTRPFYRTDSYCQAVERACEQALGMPDDCKVPSKAKQAKLKLTDEDLEQIRERAKAWRAEHCWTPNQLRHSHGTEVRAALGIEAAQMALGHHRQDTTLIYAERSLAKACEVAKQVG